MARLEAHGAIRSEVEDFLGMGRNGLSATFQDRHLIDGAAIKTTLSLRKGDEISFDWFFDAADELPHNDCAIFTINGVPWKLLDVNGTGDNAASGWRTSLYKVAASGDITLGFAVLNDRNSNDCSRLFLDNVRVNATDGEGGAIVDGDPSGPFRTVAQAPIARNNTAATNENAALRMSVGDLLVNDTDPDPFDAMKVTVLDDGEHSWKDDAERRRHRSLRSERAV